MSTRRAFLTMTAAGLASTGYGLAGMAETDAADPIWPHSRISHFGP